MLLYGRSKSVDGQRFIFPHNAMQKRNVLPGTEEIKNKCNMKLGTVCSAESHFTILFSVLRLTPDSPFPVLVQSNMCFMKCIIII